MFNVTYLENGTSLEEGGVFYYGLQFLMDLSSRMWRENKLLVDELKSNILLFLCLGFGLWHWINNFR